MNEVDLDRLRHKWNRIQQLSMLNEVLRTLATSLKLEESELRARIQEQQEALQLQIRQQALEQQEQQAAAAEAAAAVVPESAMESVILPLEEEAEEVAEMAEVAAETGRTAEVAETAEVVAETAEFNFNESTRNQIP